MTQGLAKYHARAPRYILDTDDSYLIRVAGPRQVPWEEGTEIKNISLTGLAFLAPEDLCPVLGEVIKIQFKVPSGQQMACFGIVTRIDNYDKASLLVGIHFYKLEMAHRVVLAQGISKKFKDTKTKPENTIDLSSLSTQIPQSLMLGVLLFFWTALMYGFFVWGATGWVDGILKFWRGLV